MAKCLMFKKSIFTQLFSSTVLVVLCCFVVMGTLMYGLLGNYLAERQDDELTYIAEQLADFTLYLAKQNVNYPKDSYQMNIDALSRSTDTFIVVLDADGTTITTTTIDGSVSLRPEIYAEVLEGKRVRYVGTLGGLFSTTTYSVGIPLRIGQDGIGGAIFVSKPAPEVHQLRADIIRIFLFSVCLVLVVALIVIYVVSKRITSPIKALSRAARDIATGQFDRRVESDAGGELAELGETFNKMAASIEQLETMRSSFVANVSHDLRTPMTTITGFVQGILDGTIPPEQQNRYLSIVLDETKRLSRLVTDLLDISKIEQGSYKPEMREFDINEMIRLTVIKLEKRITEKNIHLSIGFQSDNNRVLADKDSIQRVLTNLMDNAIKFTDENGFIDITTGPDGKGKVFVTVQNSGIGIEKKDLAHIFDRFYKTDKSRGLDKNGTGLGLYIAKSIIQGHGENIWAESKPGEFTRMSFTLAPAPEVRK
ncbi:MAG: HAMP domain-containing histidine kinase [Ruminococcaceae bacterium]|nr:HAMP domain-containing histidine kinase [Oscillospiraceae bacterium]